MQVKEYKLLLTSNLRLKVGNYVYCLVENIQLGLCFVTFHVYDNHSAQFLEGFIDISNSDPTNKISMNMLVW